MNIDLIDLLCLHYLGARTLNPAPTRTHNPYEIMTNINQFLSLKGERLSIGTTYSRMKKLFKKSLIQHHAGASAREAHRYELLPEGQKKYCEAMPVFYRQFLSNLNPNLDDCLILILLDNNANLIVQICNDLQSYLTEFNHLLEKQTPLPGANADVNQALRSRTTSRSHMLNNWTTEIKRIYIDAK
ncbi:MAG: hypothetical protein KDK38_09990 [Leptospiraceae bacterium]|nr:hypothetical protein [Leptospiraceae bacterium]